MSGWTALILAALVAARAPKGAFQGGEAGAPAVPQAEAVVGAPMTGAVPDAAQSSGAQKGAVVAATAGAASSTNPAATAKGDKAYHPADGKISGESKARKDRVVAFWKKTPHYFIGSYGMLAAIGMILAAYWMIVYARRPERSVYYFRSLILALVAFVLADRTYFDIANRLEVDRSAQEAAGRAWQEEVKAKQVKEAKTVGDRVEMMRFAEESDADRKELKDAGQKGESQKDELDKALESVQSPVPGEENEPDYRKKGKQKRVASTNKTEVVNADAAMVEVKQEKPWRVMLEDEMYRATRYGRIIVFLSQLMCWITLFAFLLDYLLRFNLTFDYFFPLPLSLVWADRLVADRKKLTTYCRGMPREKVVPFLEDLVRKGETFIYFGERDPLPDRDRLHRFSFGQLHVLPVRKFVCSSGKAWDGSEFVLESSWFGRGCFVVEGLPVAGRLRDDMIEFMILRLRARAWAAQTVYFIWDHDSPPPAEALDEMLACGRNTNLKVIVFSRSIPAQHGAQGKFDETYERFPTPRPAPAMLERLLRGGAADTISWMIKGLRAIIAGAGRAAWPRLRRLPGPAGRTGGAVAWVFCVIGVAVWRAFRGIGRLPWMAVRAVGRLFGKAASLVFGGSKGAGGMIGKLIAWHKERREKKAAEKARRAAEWKRLHDAKRVAEEKARQAAAAKAAGKQSSDKAAKPAEKDAPKDAAAKAPDAGSPAAKDEPKPEAGSKVGADAKSEAEGKTTEPVAGPQGKAALIERIKAKQAERKDKQPGKKVDLAQLIKAKQAALQVKAAPQKSGETGSATDAAPPATTAEQGSQAVAPAVQPVQKTADGAPVPAVAGKPSEAEPVQPQAKAEAEERQRKEREEAERLAKAKAEEDARIAREKVEQESKAKAEADERQRKEREEAERLAKAKAEEDARIAREKAEQESRAKAEAEERARREREEAERLAKARAEEEARIAREKAEQEARARAEQEARIAREKAEQEARAKAEAEDRARREREEAERAAKARAEEEARIAREKAEQESKARAEAEERLRKEREEAEKRAASQACGQPAAPSAPEGVAVKPDVASGAKRIVVVRRPGQGPIKPQSPVSVSQQPPSQAAPASLPAEPARQEPPQVPRAEAAGSGVVAGPVGGPGGAVPAAEAASAPKDAKRVVVFKKTLPPGATASAAARPKPSAPSQAQQSGLAPSREQQPVQPEPFLQQPKAPTVAPKLDVQLPTDEDVRFHCPHCGQRLAAPQKLVGRQLPCTHCGKPIVVPAPGGQPLPEAVPPSGSTIVAAPMPQAASTQVRFSFVPPRSHVAPHGGAAQEPQSPQQAEQQSDAHFKFFCPMCGQKLAARAEWAGRNLKCPACQRTVVIPSPG